MYIFIFLISLTYVGYNIYHAIKGTVPEWMEKRLYNLRNEGSFKDHDKKNETAIGGFSKFYSLSILFTSFITLTYLIGWPNMSRNVMLFMAVFFAALVVTYFMNRNLGRRVHYYTSEYATEEKKTNIKQAYGVKGWATDDEISHALPPAKDNNGQPIGIHIGHGWHWYDKGHMLCVGGSGQGKGISVILPALLSDGFSNAGISTVVLDPKGENAAVCVPHLRQAGYDVHVINPFQIPQIRDLGNSRFNPFDLIEPHEAKKMCDVLAYSLHNRQTSGDNSFFDNKCRNYLSLYMRYALHTGNGNFDYVYQKLQLPGKKREEFLALMAGGDDTFSGAQEAENIFTSLTSQSAKTEENIFGTILEAINILGDDALRNSLSTSDFDLRTIAQKPTAIFICIKHDELRYYAPWVRMFTDFLLKTLTTYYNPNRKVLVLLDEFAQLGYVNEFKNSPAVLRGYNVTLWPIVQELGQLQSIYKDAWETFISNAAVKHWLGGSMDNTTADYIAKRMPMDIKFVGSNADGSPREVQTRLMDAEQIMKFDGIICELNKLASPIKFKKVPYWELPFSKDNASPNPFY
ncbi:type IV secretory system conjugative DNA transfer family protein [Dyadobacter psychrotolerans]|uniref:Type IV secretory system conjugative DNA transfer family protein n=1 Tax=Dyadobacter psychrotolerans TaxID=2541721 RepID=A0A4R5D9G5_9BACT|nr:type IV secretory system conjugative DNA transfer family protein [Dyadobacter psychrotolerans]TDE08054.1 type IV secretory system conjugative DNA transfer family protein [Dyadobacter psychrotolerans]